MYIMQSVKASTCIVMAAATLWGCAAGVPYKAPAPAVPATFSQSAGSANADDASAWWTCFDDPLLTSLVARALSSNLDALQAATRVREARARERIVRGGQGPQINASANASEAHLSKNALPSSLASLFSGGSGGANGGSGGGIGLSGTSFRTYQAGFDASWEIDLFGGDARAAEAAQARTDGALWSQRDADVVLAAEVARTYQQLRTLQRRLALADAALATQRELLTFVQVRARNGLVADAEVLRQQRALDQSLAQREDLAAQGDMSLHALALLLGLAPLDLAGELAAPAAAASALPQVPPGLPSDLLERRPDIRMAERAVAAASADVGVATADLYPKISLTGALQLASRSLSTLVDADSLQGNVSGRVAFPLLGRDRLHATVDLRQAQADEARLAYRKTVLAALRDVEDALTRLASSRRRLDEFQRVARAALEESDIAAVQYRHGLASATEMLAARQTLQSAEDGELQAQAAAAQDVVALYKALGGGWDERRDRIEGEGTRGQAN